MSDAAAFTLDPAPSSARPTLAQRVPAITSRVLTLFERAAAAGAAPDTAHAMSLLGLLAKDAAHGTNGARAGDDALLRLESALALSPCEGDLLVLAGLPEEHEGLAGVLRALHPRGEPRPTVGLAAQVFCESADERRLFRRVLELGPAVASGTLAVSGEGPFAERNLVLADTLWPALHGLDVWPHALPRVEDPVPLEGLSTWLGSTAAARAVSALARDARCTIVVTAETEDVALHRAAALAIAAGVGFVRVALPPNAPRWALAALEAHALARGVVPLVRATRAEGAPAPDGPLALFDRFPGAAVVCARAPAPALRGLRPIVPVHAARLSPSDRRAVWAAAVPALADEAGVLAARYAIDPANIGEIAADVADVASVLGRRPTLDDVAESVRARSAVGVSTGVSLVRPRVGWDQLVLGRHAVTQLEEAVARQLQQARVLDEWGFLSQRAGSRGVRMLFAGLPGTGKTLSAEVIAHALGVDLLVVDIARIVSKWLGETEKNLAATFDLAESARAVLFFDEADALFGKRTEVADAHDRYANLETAYLLSRLERFEGLAVLSTNYRQNIDNAFIRRIEFIVDFEEPGQAEREALWRGHVPRGAPLADDVSLEELAAVYPVVGGFIRNAAVAAGFLAASEGAAIGRHHFVRAIQREYEKSGKTFPGAPPGLKVR